MALDALTLPRSEAVWGASEPTRFPEGPALGEPGCGADSTLVHPLAALRAFLRPVVLGALALGVLVLVNALRASLLPVATPPTSNPWQSAPSLLAGLALPLNNRLLLPCQLLAGASWWVVFGAGALVALVWIWRRPRGALPSP